MAIEEPVVIDTQNDTPKAPEGETADQKVARLEETNKKLFERAKSSEALVKEFKSKLSTPEKPKIEEDVVSDVKELKQIEKKRQFGYRNSLSPEETDLLFKVAGNEDPVEVLKGDDFKDLLQVRRRRTQVANAIPSSSNRSTIVEGKSFKDMTKEEREKNWDKIVPAK